jgi:two-component system sensor histidine kinase RegB
VQDDLKLLRDQVDRCRGILSKLTSLDSDEGGFMQTVTLSHLVEELVEPQRAMGVALDITKHGEGPEPVCRRNPGIMYGLGNIVDNAVDFAESRVAIEARWTYERVSLEIRDDGPGFSSEVLLRAGEPYVTTRSPDKSRQGGEAGAGLGLGLFIAKTLIERSGAQLSLSNVSSHDADGQPTTGAVVRISWARHIFERETIAHKESDATTVSPLIERGAVPI